MNREAKVIGGVVCAFLMVVSCLLAAQNDKRESQLRTVHGSVLDHNDNPIPSSVVYLKNIRSLAVKTYIADDAGHYRFSGLDPNVDYEIYAEKDSATSPHRTVSSFDSRRDIEVILRIDTKKNKT